MGTSRRTERAIEASFDMIDSLLDRIGHKPECFWLEGQKDKRDLSDDQLREIGFHCTCGLDELKKLNDNNRRDFDQSYDNPF